MSNHIKIPSDLLSILICPDSGEPLIDLGEQLGTESAKYHYPKISDIPWLLKNPLHSMVDWSVKLNHFNQVLTEEIRLLGNEVKRAPKHSQRRLKKLIEGKQDFSAQVSSLVEPILSAKVSGKPVYDALSDRAPHMQNLLSYEANLYRDWVWGAEENELTASIICKLVESIKTDKMLVLGAGSCRLAYDLHQRLSTQLTIANDINPLLLFAAKQILFGEGLTIREFPAHPREIDCIAVPHCISAVAEPPENFYLLFSDAATPSLKKESIDLLVTPWLVDIQPFELGKFLSSLNHYLVLGGHWVNFGSLVFNQSRDAFCYAIDEVKSIAIESGFEIELIEQHEIPYLKSPYNAGYRMERVWSWRATKTKNVSLAKDLENLPAWILDVSKSIPLTREIQSFAFSHAMYAELAEKIDGRQSIAQIAKRIAKEKSMDEQEALTMVKNFYLKVVQQSI